MPFLLPAAILAALLALAVVVPAAGQDLQQKVQEKRGELEQAQSKRGSLKTDVARYDRRIDRLTGEVASLRNREARVEAELAEAERQLEIEQENLEILRERLKRSVRVLERRLVAIYKSDEPDTLTVVLESDGFDDVLERYEYLQRIEAQDNDIVDRVRTLRDDTRETVERVRATRDAIAAKQAELERTRERLEAQEAQLQTAQSQSRRALGRVRGHIQKLEGDISGLEDKIQAELAAAAAAAAAESEGSATPEQLPAGPVRSGSSGMIWPVNGPMVSPFGMRWGRLHAGIDIAAPAGTPIRAAKAGTIALAAPYGGYGNYTCINHGGGLSTCYAHLTSFSVTSGSVNQGQVIGTVGCTGHCYGDHLHFEVRVNGSPTDPMGYL